jgi:hypothetical protein
LGEDDMWIKIGFLVIAILNGGWMLFDGVHVLVKGKYFGPPQPGPWSQVVTAVGLNPFSLGPLFVGLGLLWIVAAGGILQGSSWAWLLAVIVSVASLWYIPIGTLLSIIAILILILFKASLGYA